MSSNANEVKTEEAEARALAAKEEGNKYFGGSCKVRIGA